MTAKLETPSLPPIEDGARDSSSHQEPSASEPAALEASASAIDPAAAPQGSGCYLMYDAKGQVIYVGKAKNLRARLKTYVAERDGRYKVKFLLQRVARVECLVTTTEKEALLLENSLIKQHKPRYNIRLKDDKTYVSLRANMEHDFPRLTITRRVNARSGSRYFGPYASAKAVRESVRQLQRVFPLRLCSDEVFKARTRPCLYHQMKQCLAPCASLVTREEYRQIMEQALMVLEGRSADLEKLLLEHIQGHADALEFEKAAVLRDRLYALRKTLERQRTVRVEGAEDQDAFGLYVEGRFTEVQVLYFRGGKMMGGRAYTLDPHEMPIEDVFSSFVLQFYAEAATPPAEVLVPVELEEAEVLAEILSEQRGARVHLRWPQRGEKLALIDLANRNARNSFQEKRLEAEAQQDVLEQVRAQLHLARLPARIECFDISTTQGATAVGSMIVFEAGAPAKARYRRFSIHDVEGQDDFAMMREVLLRRYTRAVAENDLPDLVLVDGGVGQLNVARAVLHDLGIEDLPLASIAKARLEGESERSPERFFVPGRKNAIVLPQHGAVVRFLARIRDEAHRFAIGYHRKRRARATIRTALREIPGVGAKRAAALLKTFGSIERVRNAGVAELAALPGFGMVRAQQIHEQLAAMAAASPARPAKAAAKRE